MEKSSIIEKSRLFSQIIDDNASTYLSLIQSELQDSDSLLQKAIAMFNMFRYKNCIDITKEIIKRDKNNIEALHLTAQGFRKLNKFKESNACLNKCVLINTENGQYFYEMALNYEELKQFEKAISFLKKAIEITPNFFEGYYKRGCLLNEVGKYTEAKDDLNKAIEINPNNEEYYFTRSQIKFNQKNYEECIIDAETCLRLDSTFANALILKCKALEKIGKQTEVLIVLHDYLKDNEDMKFQASQINSDILSYDSNPEEGLISEVINDLNFFRVRILINIKDYKKALMVVGSQFIEQQNLKEAWFYLAVLNLELNNYEESIKTISKAIAYDNNNFYYYLFRGFLFLKIDKQKAKNDFLKANQLCQLKTDDFKYFHSDSQKELHDLLFANIERFVPDLLFMVSEIVYLEKELGPDVYEASSKESRFDQFTRKFKGAYQQLMVHLLWVFGLNKTAIDSPLIVKEFVSLIQTFTALSKEYSFMLNLTSTATSPAAINEFLSNNKDKKTGLFDYIEIFYITWVVYIHQLGVLKEDFSMIHIDGYEFDFIQFNNPIKLNNFAILAAPIFEFLSVGKKIQQKQKIELIFEAKLQNVVNARLKFYFLAVGYQITQEEKKWNMIEQKKLNENQEKCWDVVRKHLKKLGKYDKLKTFIETESKKQAFVDVIFSILYFNEFYEKILESEGIFADDLSCLILSGGHLDNFLKMASQNKKKSKLESILETF